MVDNTSLVNLLSYTEIHNWIMKIIQCTSYLLEYSSKTLKSQQKFSSFGNKVASARKIYRVFKFLNDIPRMYYLISCSYDSFSKNINFLSRFFSSIFYFLENINILQYLRLVDNKFLIHSEIIMSLSFLLSQTFQIIYYLFVIKKTYDDEVYLKQSKQKEILSKKTRLIKIRFSILLALVRCLGDLSLSFYDLKLFESVFSGRLSKLIFSITGLMSSVVAIYQLSC